MPSLFFFSCREGLISSLLPQVGMEFNTIDEAWMFWISYGGQKGFEVRKLYTNKRKVDGKLGPADMFVKMRVRESLIKGTT